MLSTLFSRLGPITAAAALRLFPVSLLLSSSIVWCIVAAQPEPRPSHPYAPELQEFAGYGVIAGFLLAGCAWIFRDVKLRKSVEASDIKYYLLSLQAGMLLLAAPAYLYVFKSPHENIRWILDLVFDKRWKFAIYWLGMGTFLFLPYFFRYLFPNRPEKARAARKYKSRKAGAEETAVAAGGEAVPQATAGNPARRKWAVHVLLALAGSAALAYFYAGPPWNLERHHRVIDSHEQVHLGPLQAMDKGYLAYVGPASTQYVPGSQIFVYTVMKWMGPFDLVTYRKAGAAIYCLSVFLFCFVAAMVLPAWAVPPVLLLGLLYSPLTFYYWGPDGALGGFYGWANAFRYMGILIVAAFLPGAVAARSVRPARWFSGGGFALGLAWGLFSWLAQENLSSTVAASTMLLSVLWLSGTVNGRAVVVASVNMIAGFAVFWFPVMAYYAQHGAAGEFLRCYFLVPSMVVEGYSNTDWSSGATDPEYFAFCYTALVVAVLGVATLTDWKTLRLCAPLDAKRVRMFAFLCALAASYPAALFRSDTSHLRATLTALPFVILLAVADVPGWLAAGKRARIAWSVALAGAALWIYPLWRDPVSLARTVALAPLGRFAAGPVEAAPPADPRIPFQRVTRLLADEPIAFDGAPPMREFLEELSALREIVGTRSTYVESFPRTMIGLVYVLLDLKAAPYLLDKDLLVVNEVVEKEALAYYEKHAAESECIVSISPGAPEVRAFRRAHPGFTTIERKLRGRSYFVLLAPQANARAASLAK